MTEMITVRTVGTRVPGLTGRSGGDGDGLGLIRRTWTMVTMDGCGGSPDFGQYESSDNGGHPGFLVGWNTGTGVVSEESKTIFDVGFDDSLSLCGDYD